MHGLSLLAQSYLIPLILEFGEKPQFLVIVADYESEYLRGSFHHDVFLGTSEVDFTPFSFALFLSSNITLYKSTILANCIPLVLPPYFSIKQSFWLDALIWRLDEPMGLENVSDWIREHVRIDAFEQTLLNFLVQKQILTYYQLPPSENSPSSRPLKVFIGILNRRDDAYRRGVIRETWLSSFLSFPNATVKHVFFVGLGPETPDESFRDIITLNVIEEYGNVGVKSNLMLHYISEHFPDVDIVIILDDDIYIRPHQLLEYLQQSMHSNSWLGSFTHSSRPVREVDDDRQFVSYDQFPVDSFYPAYTRGFAYAISRDLLNIITAGNHPLSLSESVPFGDAALGLRIFEEINSSGIKVTIDDRLETLFAIFPNCTMEFSGANDDSIVIHKVSGEQTRCMWLVDSSNSNTSICACL
jgi:hypothetical protein